MSNPTLQKIAGQFRSAEAVAGSPSPIEEEINREIKNRYWYSRFDFTLDHLLVFTSVIASAFPAFAQVVGIGDGRLVAVIAAIPAFVLLLQKTFKWQQRGEWHWDYRRKVLAIKRELRDQGLTPQDASKRLNELEAGLAGTFPGLQRPTSQGDGY
jgi:hypothetical protein